MACCRHKLFTQYCGNSQVNTNISMWRNCIINIYIHLFFMFTLNLYISQCHCAWHNATCPHLRRLYQLPRHRPHSHHRQAMTWTMIMYRTNRHDTASSIFNWWRYVLRVIMLLPNCSFISFFAQVVLSGQPTSNVILSPFAVKMLMSVLAEAAGKGTVTERELANVLPDVNSNPLAREFYTRVLRSLQVCGS